MQRLLENWRQYLKEEAGAGDYYFEIMRSPRKIMIQPLEKQSRTTVLSKNQEGKTDAYLEMALRNGIWEVAAVGSPAESKGVGLTMYLLAMELAENKGLSPDSVENSQDALKIWEILRNYPDIVKEKKQEYQYDSDDDPFFFVWYKKNADILEKLKNNNHLSIKTSKSIEKEPEIEEDPFDPDTFDWDELDSIDEVQKNDTNKISKVFIIENNKILALKRHPTSNIQPKKWDLPGGHLKKGENHVDGAKREVKEETNLEISGLKEEKTEKNVVFLSTSQFSGKIKLDLSENTEFQWVSAENIDDFEFFPGLKAKIKKILTIKEDYQAKIKKNHCKMKRKNLNLGKNNKKEGPGITNSSCKRAASAPPGAGGS